METPRIYFPVLERVKGIGHPRQPLRLHAPWRSQARRMRLETPAAILASHGAFMRHGVRRLVACDSKPLLTPSS